jgi:hypothetical protein
MSFLDAVKANVSLVHQLGLSNAYFVWALALYLEAPDVSELAAEALTDGGDDKKIDFIYLDSDAKKLIFAQGYFAERNRDSAPANKASDLNTACAWLLSGDLGQIPERLRDIVAECRVAIEEGEIEGIELLYVHNLPESINIARELQTVADHMKTALGDRPISVRAFEFGGPKVEHLFGAQESHMRITTEIELPADTLLREEGPDWSASVASVPGAWLHDLFQRYGDDLFSANYRGFLGITKRRRINTGIRQSAEARPADFWAFNNGITVLTLALKKEGKKTILTGISIINGAQTTGSIGSIEPKRYDLSKVKVLCRIIECSSKDKIDDIVKYNNTQNEIMTWDQYSNDPEQKRIESELKELGFQYNRKRGFLAMGDQVGIEEVAQPLLAFHGRPQDAVRGRNQIFDRKQLYTNAFEGKKARHLLLVHSLAKAIDQKRLDLKRKSSSGELIQIEENQLGLLRNLRFKSFMIAVVAQSLEAVIGKRCDPMAAGFTTEAAESHTLVELVARWGPVVDAVLAYIIASGRSAEFPTKLADENYVKDISSAVTAFLHASNAPKTFSEFAEMVAGT